MYNLGLLGKNISHSKSPEVYKNLLGLDLTYKLIDHDNYQSIPSLIEIFKELDGLSITSPYKKHFVNDVLLVGVASKLLAINCIRKNGNSFEGANTDYLAIVDILNKYFQDNNFSKIIVLGNGVMSNVVCHALGELNKKPEVFSRNSHPNFSELNLLDLFNQEKILVINTCAREFTYKNQISKNALFWDFNYDFPSHKVLLSSKCDYRDGHEMLVSQAKYALAFWSIKKNF